MDSKTYIKEEKGGEKEEGEKEEGEKEILVHQFSFIVHQQTYKIIQKIKINGIYYRIDDLDNLYDFTTFKFLKNLNIDE